MILQTYWGFAIGFSVGLLAALREYRRARLAWLQARDQWKLANEAWTAAHLLANHLSFEIARQSPLQNPGDAPRPPVH